MVAQTVVLNIQKMIIVEFHPRFARVVVIIPSPTRSSLPALNWV